MTFNPKSDHKQASLTLYHVVALNTESILGRTINKIGAAQVLADLLQIDRRAPMSWLRGDFIKHPLSRENFLKFIRVYRIKPGLENAKEITALAISIYGSDYKRAIELLDPADRESNLTRGVLVTLPGESDMVMAICNLLESSPEAIEIALGTMTTYQWTASELLEKLKEVPDEIEIGADKIISVIISQFSGDLHEAFSKLGGLPELALYNLDCFETLWEKTDKELVEIVALFEKLNLIWAIKENEWKIKPQVLSIARQFLEVLPEYIQLRTHNWWRRFLDKPKYLEAFRSHLYSKYADLSRFSENKNGKKQKNEINVNNKFKSFLKNLKRRLFDRVDTDWECMQLLSYYMSYDDFVFAQFILMRRKRDLFFGFLISLWIGTTPLLHQSPLLMGCIIIASVYASFLLLIDLHHCENAWADLWDKLVARAKSVDG